MGKPRALIVIAAALLFGSIGNAAIQPGKVLTFKNWAVGCDNVGMCQSVPLSAPDAAGQAMALTLSRAAGAAGAISISISAADSHSDRYQLLVDDRVVDTGPLMPDAAPVKIGGKEALRIVQSMKKGLAITLVDGAGVVQGKASLAGYTAALRHIDVVQGRAGTNSALVVRGRKAMRKPALTAPLILAKKVVPTPNIPDATSLVALAESSKCAPDREGVIQDTAYSLGKLGGTDRALALISCGNGAYNFSTAVYIGSLDVSGKWTFEPAKFDYEQNIDAAKDGLQLIINGGWDAASQTISSSSRARGVGDCGRAQTYIWDGNMFRLVRASVMDECRGSLNWITVWQADSKLVS